jgi:hypothetical protein
MKNSDAPAVKHLAGVEDLQVAKATYLAACQRWPGTPITLRQRQTSNRRQSADSACVKNAAAGNLCRADAVSQQTEIGTVKGCSDEIGLIPEGRTREISKAPEGHAVEKGLIPEGGAGKIGPTQEGRLVKLGVFPKRDAREVRVMFEGRAV